jgi:hypothetical protein
VCVQHHTRVHNHGWHLELTAGRDLTVTLPDGTLMSTGPPGRRAA